MQINNELNRISKIGISGNNPSENAVSTRVVIVDGSYHVQAFFNNLIDQKTCLSNVGPFLWITALCSLGSSNSEDFRCILYL